MKYCTVCKSKYEDSVSFCPTDGEVLEDDPSSIVGTVLDGQYNIESLLGKGGMGAVYLARHILLGDRVAIKILPPEVRNNAEWLRRFRREGQAARRFRHPNAVTVYDLRTSADGTIYMVMEYVEGQTLDAELKSRGRFTAEEAFEILEPIMSVLNTAHAMGVVHRDLKPENIMIGKAQTGQAPAIKLLDLGIAKMREIAGGETTGTTELTMAGQVLGTPYYMSPEQWGEISRDGNPEIDGRTDIYSLGLVTYQLISGHRPYSATTLHELRREHVSVMPPPLSQTMPDVPPAFSDAITRSIAKDRSDRQATAGELAEELRAALANAPKLPDSGRTLPEMPHPDSSWAHTSGTPGGLSTKSDVNAETILTVDSTPTTPPTVPRPVAPPVVSSGAAAAGVGATGQGAAVAPESIVTVVRPQPDQPPAKKSGSKSLVFIGATVLILVLAVVGVGGFFAVNWMRGTGTPENPGNGPSKNPAIPVPVGRYWLEAVAKESTAIPRRIAGSVPLKSGENYKFHFQFDQSGYVYVLGPGKLNQPTAFLTNHPTEGTGLTSNQATRDTDFSFPASDKWLGLDLNPGAEDFTIIFSTERLAAPAFLGTEATGEPLNETEQAELRDFLAKYKTTDPVTEIDDKDPNKPFVRVKVPPGGANGAGSPVVFNIRIQHN
ncbi:MAG TPA: serine/threonine-protein kinase [Pyrinomonadaceae bacterium]|nr:serine/threonine-protein kinase [Pyrinomonadaceae bacterium]